MAAFGWVEFGTVHRARDIEQTKGLKVFNADAYTEYIL